MYQAPLSMEFSSKNTGMDYHSILQGIFPTQGSNPGLLYCRQILYHLNSCCSVTKLCPTLWTLWTAAHQASLSFTISQSLLKLMSIELVMPSNHLSLCCPLLLLPSIFPSIRAFSSESALHIRWPKYWSFNLSISLPIYIQG